MASGDIYLFWGEDEFLKDEATKAVLTKGTHSACAQVDRDIYSAKDENNKVIFEALNSLPFLSKRRAVVIKDIEDLPDAAKDSLSAYIKRPPEYIILILQTRLVPAADKFIKYISGYAKTVQFKKPDRKMATDRIYAKLNSCKKTIERPALGLLLELKGVDDLALLDTELDKLIAYTGGRKGINEEDVERLIGNSIRKKVFELKNAITRKEKDSAIAIARDIPADKANISNAIGYLGWYFRDLERREARLLNAKKVRKAFKLMVEADRKIKTGHPKPRLLLEELILGLVRLL